MKRRLFGWLAALALVASLGTFYKDKLVEAAPIPLPSGPVEPSQILALLNTIIGQINQYYGYGYIKSVAVTAGTYSMSTYQFSELLNASAGTIATLTVNLPVGILDGARACIFSGTTITQLILSGGANTINNAVTTLSAAGRVCYTYGASNTTWDRSQ